MNAHVVITFVGNLHRWRIENMNNSFTRNDDGILDIQFRSTEEVSIPPRLVDQVIGQDHAVEVIKKAATQRRHVMMLGEPGTGKSLLGRALSELLPRENLQDVICYPNTRYPNQPHVLGLPSGEARKRVDEELERARKSNTIRNIIVFLIPLIIIIAAIVFAPDGDLRLITILLGLLVAGVVFIISGQLRGRSDVTVSNIIVDNSMKEFAPFEDATGAHSGALLGDVRHDPFQSGGLGTPPHDRVEGGLIHKANNGVLFVDEIGTLQMRTQQQLLTAIQEGKLSITGQSELSSGAMVRTEAVPCKFILIAAGNLETIRNMHPALRSRIRGSGYEIYMREEMPDTMENRRKLIRFVAQEISNDKSIPHFSRDAVINIIEESRRRTDRKFHLTLLMREMGGIVRAAGDLALARNEQIVSGQTVLDAKVLARSLESQIANTALDVHQSYGLVQIEGTAIGRVNGLVVRGQHVGSVTPIESEVTPSQSAGEGRIVTTGQLRVIARESVQNVSALIKRYVGRDISQYDVHIQFLLTHGGVEGDSASITVATAVISALQEIPLRQDTAMTGSLSVRGTVLPVGGITYKIEAAAKAGIKRVLIPKSNLDDVKIEKKFYDVVEIIPVSSLYDVLVNIFPDEYQYVAEEFIEITRQHLLPTHKVHKKDSSSVSSEYLE